MDSKLLKDILSIIFEELEEETSTLYSCIFVNREWCQLVIPFLWKNPWKNIQWGNNMINRCKRLFRCFLMMMSKESKEFLKINGINSLIEFKSDDDFFFIQQQKPLFNYTSFCKVIDSIKIYNMIYYGINNINNINLVEQEILKLLIFNTSKIKCLVLSNSHPITTFPNSSMSLSHLNELHCHATIDEGTFYELSKLCKNIEKLVVEGYNDNNHGLILFIEKQINLKSVKIWKRNNIELISNRQSKMLEKALSTKSSSIIELDLGNSIPPLLLKNFQNNLLLTILRFGIPYCSSEFDFLKDISLPNLQQLIIYDNYCPPLNIVSKIIEKTNGNLKKIAIGNSYCYDEDHAFMLIFSIAQYCPKLELLAILVDDFSEIQIIELIKKCQKLKGLVLRTHYNEETVKLFKILCNNSSNQLRTLQFDGNWEFSENVLSDFFEDWKQKQKNSLDFYISSKFHVYSSYVFDIIQKYQEIGVVRKFERYGDGIYNFLYNW